MKADAIVANEAFPVRAGRAYDVVEFSRIIRRQWHLIAGALAGGLGVALLYFLVAPRTYESSAQILIIARNSNLPNQSGEGVREISATTADDLFATHMQLLKSLRIVKHALEQHDLASLPSIVNSLARDQSPEEYVIDQLDVQRGGKGRAKQGHVLTVSLRLKSAEDAESVLSALIESYQDFLGETFQDLSKEAIQLISDAKDQLEQELTMQEAAYTKFRETAPLLWEGEHSVNIHQLRAIEIERALAELTIRQAAVKSRLEIVQHTLGGTDGAKLADLDRLALIDEKDIARLDLVVNVQNGEPTSEAFEAKQPARSETARSELDRLVSLQMQESVQMLELGIDHPKLQQTRESIKHLGGLLVNQRSRLGDPEERPRVTPAELMEAYIKLLKHDVSDLESRQLELQRQYQVEEAAAKAMVSVELEGELISKSLNRKEQLYNVVVERLRQINLTKDYGGYVTEVIAPVGLGERVWPRGSICLLLGAIVGLFIGSGSALGIESKDKTFRSVEELRSSIPLPLLAAIPDLKIPPEVVDEAGVGQPGLSGSLLTFHKPHSREAEAFRGLRTALYFNNPVGDLKLLQITSANMSDGKTTLAANLAISLAQSGRRTLLIDADMRRPQVASIFAVESDTGLSSAIGGDTEIIDATLPSGVANLWLMPCGAIPPNPAELLSQPRFSQLLGVVRDQFDFVIIDSPPLLAVSDPLIVAPLVDGVIVSIRFSKNGRPASIHACEMIDLPGVNVLGMVANCVAADATSTYGGYYGVGSANEGYYTARSDTRQSV